MKPLLRLMSGCLFAGVLLAPALAAPAADSASDLAAQFLNPPDSARPLTWWHWLNGCITKEGITADLESMQRVGLGGAQVFTVQQTLKDPDNAPVKGDVVFLSPEWRELIHHAEIESQRLGLQFSILNCEGWSESGGPWVTPPESMQKVVWSEAQVDGGGRVPLTVPRPLPKPKHYEDTALLAFPTPAGDDISAAPTFTPSAVTRNRFENDTYDHGARQKHSSEWEKPLFTMPLPMPGAPQWVRVDYDRSHTFSSIFMAMDDMRDIADPERWDHSAFLDAAADAELRKAPAPHYFELQVSDDGAHFRPVGRISSHGTSSFPPVTARSFRIWMPVPPPLQKALPFRRTEVMEITRIVLGGPRLDRPELRAGQYIDENVKEFSHPAAPPAGIVPGSIVDLTGKTEWDAPAGRWTLLRIGHGSTGVNVGPAVIGGLEVDKLSRDAVLHHLTRGVVSTVIADAGPLAGTTLKNILCDSWERGYENWTPLMREEFLRRRGYSLDQWLPAIAGHVVLNEEASERFLWDFRRTIADLLAENYYGTMQAFAHAHHMGVFAEATGHGLPTISDQLMCKGRCDVPMGEFWASRGDVNDTKEAASGAHIYGQNLAGAESFTAEPKNAGWRRAPWMFKAEGDLRFCMGINQMCFHEFAHQPWLDRAPGMALGPYGSNLCRTNTWWEEAGPWIKYLTRCEYLLRQGRFVADFCYFYGEDAPMDFRFERLDPKVPPGYDFDACNAEILERLTFRDGKLRLPSGMSYRALVLPNSRRMTPRVLRAIQVLVRAGATVVGPKPDKSPSLTDYPQCDETVRSIADAVWGDCDGQAVTEHAYGAGRIQWGRPLADAAGVRADFSSDDADLHYIHRRSDEGDIYFVSNQRNGETDAACSFRVGNRVPELWHPDTGRTEDAAHYGSDGGVTRVWIHFDPIGSVFVVFRRASDGRGRFAPPEATIATTVVSGPWEVRFPPRLGAPPEATFADLRSWSEADQEGVRYFSGTATYRKHLTVPADALQPNRRLYLDLGSVREICRVALNGRDLGILWKPPFRTEITTAAVAGDNRLEIQVTNLWPNRLIGDRRVPKAARVTWTTQNPFTADSPLLPSGLLGPVTLVTRGQGAAGGGSGASNW